LSESAFYNAVMRTTCVATRVEAGHANNALPQTARANVNCRILPQESPADVQAALVRVLDDAKISVAMIGANNPDRAAPPQSRQSSPLDPRVLSAMERVTAVLWPGVPVRPVL